MRRVLLVGLFLDVCVCLSCLRVFCCCVMLCSGGQSWRTEEALPLDLSAVGPRGVGIALRGQRLREGRVGHAAGLEDGGADDVAEGPAQQRLDKRGQAGIWSRGRLVYLPRV